MAESLSDGVDVIMLAARTWKYILAAGLVAGIAQVLAGVAMYFAGVYFAAWSMGVSVLVLAVCIVAGTMRIRSVRLNGQITYAQALAVGVAISVSTGLVYAVYNVISIGWYYPDFLDAMVRAGMDQAAANGQSVESFEALRAKVSARGIAIGNCVRLSALGTVLSLVTSRFLRSAR